MVLTLDILQKRLLWSLEFQLKSAFMIRWILVKMGNIYLYITKLTLVEPLRFILKPNISNKVKFERQTGCQVDVNMPPFRGLIKTRTVYLSSSLYPPGPRTVFLLFCLYLKSLTHLEKLCVKNFETRGKNCFLNFLYLFNMIYATELFKMWCTEDLLEHKKPMGTPKTWNNMVSMVYKAHWGWCFLFVCFDFSI